ncbi:MAG: hypothetical protein SFZ23_10965 [Planctomycetota bacterium]|nr:hypothetical protein [Planctomycetota bacterium]
MNLHANESANTTTHPTDTHPTDAVHHPAMAAGLHVGPDAGMGDVGHVGQIQQVGHEAGGDASPPDNPVACTISTGNALVDARIHSGILEHVPRKRKAESAGARKAQAAKLALLKAGGVHSYQALLYNRALHPDFFPLRDRRVIRHDGYELEGWAMPGAHVLRFERGPICLCELVTNQERNLPDTGVVNAFLCAGEHEFEQRFSKSHVTYMVSVQTETLSEGVYAATFDELVDYGKEQGGMMHEWSDSAGPCATIVSLHRRKNEVFAEAFHLIAEQGFVLRSQTIFEHS